jgi:hypothetical protein
MRISITTDDSDDPVFIGMIERTVVRLDQDHDPDELFVIKIKNWFDHKWLKFSGIGRVRFERLDSKPQVALAPIFRDKITFPPFTPNRVLLQQCWGYGAGKPRRAVHRTLRREHSSWNLQRRVTQFAKSALFVWFSSGTKPNDRGSLMVYQVKDEEVEAWYASFKKTDTWTLDRTKGVSQEAIESLAQAIRIIVPFKRKVARQ